MREAMKAAMSLSWATSLFGVEQMTRMVADGGGSAAQRSFDAVSRTAAAEIGLPRDGDATPVGAAGASPWPDTGAAAGRLDIRCVVAIGEGLAAGVGDFAWSETSQRQSFAVQAAKQMRAVFVLPTLQSPGIYGVPGLPPQPVILPHLLQTTVVDEFPPRRRYNNLALPGYELADCVRRRPTAPLVHRNDVRQTAANLVLGLPALTTDPGAARPTQLEYALDMNPTLVIVELGFAEVLRYAFSNAGEPPVEEQWAVDYADLVRAFRGRGSEVIVSTVPDPADTAGCLPLDAAARALRVSVADMCRRYGVAAGDCLTISGLTRAAFQVLGGSGAELEPGGIVTAALSRAVSDRVGRMNAAIEQTAREHGAVLFDLNAVLRAVRERGVRVGDRHVTADFLGGFYGLSGVYPGATGQAVIANELLVCLNRAFGASLPPLDLVSIAQADAVADYRSAGGAARPFPDSSATPAPARSASVPPRRGRARPVTPIRLPSSLEMTRPLSHAGSYHGDAIRVVDCDDEAASRFGNCAGVLFGGPVLFDSHVAGVLHFRFTPPENDLARFTMTFEPLEADDGVLSAPMFFRWPVQQARVVCEPTAVSGGTLNLATGEVSDITLSVRYLNSALAALLSVNPEFPDQPIVFPGQYGSAWAKFEQDEDGALDFMFYGSTFLPLGARFGNDAVRWALPLAGTPFEFASIRAKGMALHPHLQLSTRDPADKSEPEERAAPVDLPHNTVRELTLFTRRSSFGDRFTLNTPELGGPATGRSHLLGRLLIQTGEPFGGSMPVAVWLMTPGGLLGQQAPPPLAALFPGLLSPGPVGHDEHLRFPIRNYFLDAVTLVDDPFDFSVGAVDLASGRFINPLLHRAFIGQDLFFSLLRVEPRTPRESFLFRGPASLTQHADGELLLRLRAAVQLPYPAGFAFPAPDLTSAIIVGRDSVLDPYLWLRASSDRPEPTAVSLRRDRVRSSTGEEFSYQLEVREGAPQPLRFEYTNHEQRGTFRLETLSWFGRSRVPTQTGESEAFTFSGFGRWSKDPTGRAHQAAVQIAAHAEEYVSIQIDSGLVSNVNTRPEEESLALP